MNKKFSLLSVNQQNDIAHNTLTNIAEKSNDYDLSSRRDAIKLLSAFFVIGSSSWLASQQKPWQNWLADYQTAVGEQQQITLRDGSQVTLNTNTAIDINYTSGACNISLIKGEIYIKSGNDLARKQTLRVSVSQGQVQPIGTRFSVRQADNQSHVAVFEGKVIIKPSNNADAVTLSAGKGVFFTENTWSKTNSVSEAQAAWTHGMIVVSNMALDKFLLELNRYRYGVIQCDPAIAQLKISGTYPINEADKVLQTLTYALPIKLQRYTQYWVRVLPKS
jgi:transmembrane sensor